MRSIPSRCTAVRERNRLPEYGCCARPAYKFLPSDSCRSPFRMTIVAAGTMPSLRRTGSAVIIRAPTAHAANVMNAAAIPVHRVVPSQEYRANRDHAEICERNQARKSLVRAPHECHPTAPRQREAKALPRCRNRCCPQPLDRHARGSPLPSPPTVRSACFRNARHSRAVHRRRARQRGAGTDRPQRRPSRNMNDARDFIPDPGMQMTNRKEANFRQPAR